MRCCFPAKLLGSRREDRYKVSDDAKEPSTAAEQRFSWETRGEVDLSEFIIRDVHTSVKRIQGAGMNSMQIENCTGSFLLLLKSSASITVDDCRDSLIILGPCSGSVFIRDCTNCVIMTACQQLRTRDSHSLRLGVLCATQPIIESSDDVDFYPLVLNYEGFKEQLKQASLSPLNGRILSVHDFTPTVKPNFRLIDTPWQFGDDQVKTLSAEGVFVEAHRSLLPICQRNRSSAASMFISSWQDVDEASDDFVDRCSEFSKSLVGAGVVLVASNDINVSKMAENLIPVAKKSERLVLFEVIADKQLLVKLVKESFLLFELLPEDQTSPVRAFILMHSKRD